MNGTPELPDITVYVERLRALTASQPLWGIKIMNPFLLRTASPEPADLLSRAVIGVERIGKRIVLGFEEDYFAVIHLMIAGRLRWVPAVQSEPESLGARAPGSRKAAAPNRAGPGTVATFEFPNGHLFMTEAGTKHRASLHLARGREQLTAFDRGGVSVLDDSPRAFISAMRRENRTLKRALTDPSIIDGIGNAYSDEILHRARMSPFALTRSLEDADLLRLRQSAAEVLVEWTEQLREEAGPGLPVKVTAFHPEMAVHGKYGKPCPVCGAPVQRVVYADNEANYCPVCQTGGKVLADRGLSRLLKEDWPRTLDELEKLRTK